MRIQSRRWCFCGRADCAPRPAEPRGLDLRCGEGERHCDDFVGGWSGRHDCDGEAEDVVVEEGLIRGQIAVERRDDGDSKGRTRVHGTDGGRKILISWQSCNIKGSVERIESLYTLGAGCGVCVGLTSCGAMNGSESMMCVLYVLWNLVLNVQRP